jgi:fatty acid kinase fatty acid binding subunit
MADTVAVVTDSTACLGSDIASAPGATGAHDPAGSGGFACAPGGSGGANLAGLDVRVVPLRIVIGGQAYDDTPASRAGLSAAFARGSTLTTSRPSPQRFARAYAEAAATGASGIVSVHLSSRMSGTVDSARLAAGSAPVPVVVVDTRTAGAGLGFAVQTAASAARSGGTLTEVAAAAAARSRRLRSLFCLGSMDQLRRGGRAGGDAGPQGAVLGGKQLMQILDGQIVPFERVRTMARALARLEQLAAEAAEAPAGTAPAGELAVRAGSVRVSGAARLPVDVAVQHVANGERAAALAARLRARIPRLRVLHVSEVGPVMAVHTGPDMLGIVVAPDTQR